MKKRKLLLGLLVFAIIGMVAGTMIAAPSFEGETDAWTMVGPNNVSGRVRAALFDKYNKGVVYAGTVGGLYVSVNNGKNWREVPLAEEVQSVTALAQDENGILYVGTGDGYYDKNPFNENPSYHSNYISGKIGTGIYKQINNENKYWASEFTTDNEKYEYILEAMQFNVIESTVPNDKYDWEDEWAYINTMACVGTDLYVGTKNGGLKYFADGSETYTDISAVTGNINDIVVNSLGRIAVSFFDGSGHLALNNEGQADQFSIVFDESNVAEELQEGDHILRTKIAFGKQNPNNIFIVVASGDNSSRSILGQSAYLQGVYRSEIVDNGNLTWSKISPNTLYLGNTLGQALAIAADDNDEEEVVYVGGLFALYRGKDVNGEGTFSWNTMSNSTQGEVSGSFVGHNIHNIILAGEDSLFVTTDAGAFTYYYDTVIRVRAWQPATKGMNNLQAYRVVASADGSVAAATEANAIVYIPNVTDTMKGGQKIWSVNNTNYMQYINNALDRYTSYTFAPYTGSAVQSSAIYRTTPSVRKPFVFSRPGTNLTRTYSNGGDYSSIDNTTWTFNGGETQTLMSTSLTRDPEYSPYNTPVAYWESFDYAANNDSVDLKLNAYTKIHSKNGVVNDNRFYGVKIIAGDSVLVTSDNVDYPFYHKFSASDLDVLSTVNDTCYDLGTEDTLFITKDDIVIKVPQPIQARTVVATNTGIFVCGKIMDFKRTYTASSVREEVEGSLAWVKLFHTGDSIDGMAQRINYLAITTDGNSVFAAINNYTGTAYQNSTLVRIDGLNEVNLNDPFNFMGIVYDTQSFRIHRLIDYNRPISSIYCDPTDVNKVMITFDGAELGPNVMISENALADEINFTDISLKIDRNGQTNNRKPVFKAIYETVGNSGRVYAGSDDGIYYYEDGQWTVETSSPNIAVYDLWQQTAKLPEWHFDVYTSGNSESYTYQATANTGIIYAATYGKGILVNRTYLDDSKTVIDDVSLADVSQQENGIAMEVYPNPAVNQANISYTLTDASNVEFRMMDLNGKEVSSFNAGRQAKGSHTQVMDIRNLKSGMYIIQIVTENSTRTSKLVVK